MEAGKKKKNAGQKEKKLPQAATEAVSSNRPRAISQKTQKPRPLWCRCTCFCQRLFVINYFEASMSHWNNNDRDNQ
jgi:hypothetical protein